MLCERGLLCRKLLLSLCKGGEQQTADPEILLDLLWLRWVFTRAFDPR